MKQQLVTIDKGYVPNTHIELKICNNYSPELCQKNTSTLFIFGENQSQQGWTAQGGGQAIIRPEENSFGFCTLEKIAIYWSDKNYSSNIIQIETDIITIKELLKLSIYDTICFPLFGLGTGRASMQSNCIKTFLYMCERLLKEFNYNNCEFLSPENY